jgi:hypothetical protein
MYTLSWLENRKGTDHLEDLMDLREIGWGVVDWMHLAWNRDQWRDLQNTVMKFFGREIS